MATSSNLFARGMIPPPYASGNSTRSDLANDLSSERFNNCVDVIIGNIDFAFIISVFFDQEDTFRHHFHLVRGDAKKTQAGGNIIRRTKAAVEEHRNAQKLASAFERLIHRGDDDLELMSLVLSREDAGTLLFLVGAHPDTEGWRELINQRLSAAGPLLLELAGAERTMQRARLRLALLESVLDEMAMACFMLDAQCRPFCMNTAAFDYLAATDPLRLSRAGTLECTKAKDALTLHRTIRAIINAPDGEPERAVVLDASDGRKTIGTVRCVSAGNDGTNRAALLMIPDGLHPSIIALEALGLTGAERRFLSAFLECGELSTASELLGLSGQTGRTYLKRVCAKLGVRKQFELAALVWRMSPPLRRPVKMAGKDHARQP